MKQRYVEIAPNEVPNGVYIPLVVLVFEPAEFSARYRVTFSDDVDDQDYYKSCIVRIPNGNIYVLSRHRRSVQPGLVVQGDELKATPKKLYQDFLAAFSLNTNHLNWINPLCL